MRCLKLSAMPFGDRSRGVSFSMLVKQVLRTLAAWDTRKYMKPTDLILLFSTSMGGLPCFDGAFPARPGVVFEDVPSAQPLRVTILAMHKLGSHLHLGSQGCGSTKHLLLQKIYLSPCQKDCPRMRRTSTSRGVICCF